MICETRSRSLAKLDRCRRPSHKCGFVHEIAAIFINRQTFPHVVICNSRYRHYRSSTYRGGYLLKQEVLRVSLEANSSLHSAMDDSKLNEEGRIHVLSHF